MEQYKTIDLQDYKEWDLLRGEGVVASPEAATVPDEVSAEELRTRCSLHVLSYLLKGGRVNYNLLTAVQPEDDRLAFDEFKELGSWTRSVLRSTEDRRLMSYIMLIHDAGKNEMLYDLAGIKRGSVDHDQLLGHVLSDDRLGDVRAEHFPQLESFSAENQKLLADVLSVDFNLGQFLQTESPEAGLDAYLKMRSQRTQELHLLHTVLDIAGVAGHIHSESSLVLTSSFYRNLKAAQQALHAEKGNSNTIYAEYLKFRAAGFCVDRELSDVELAQSTRAKVRLACMLRLQDREGYLGLEAIYNTLSEVEKEIIEEELGKNGIADRARLPYYGPALLANFEKQGALKSGLIQFSHLLQEGHISDVEAGLADLSGMTVMDIGEVARAASGSRETAEYRMRRAGDMLHAERYDVPSILKGGMKNGVDTRAFKGKRLMVVGMGGGSDVVQAVAVGSLLSRVGAEVPLAVSIRGSHKELNNAGEAVGHRAVEVLAGSSAVGGWRFVENAPLEDRSFENNNLRMFIRDDAGNAQELRDDLFQLAERFDIDAVLGVDTGGDALFMSELTDGTVTTDTTPDQDLLSLEAIAGLEKYGLSTYSAIVSPGIDSPPYAEDILRSADARVLGMSWADSHFIRNAYRAWRMDGGAAEEGRYGKTPQVWLKALQGQRGLQSLRFPEGQSLKSSEPWRAFIDVTDDMAAVVIMGAVKHLEAISRPV